MPTASEYHRSRLELQMLDIERAVRNVAGPPVNRAGRGGAIASKVMILAVVVAFLGIWAVLAPKSRRGVEDQQSHALAKGEAIRPFILKTSFRFETSPADGLFDPGCTLR